LRFAAKRVEDSVDVSRDVFESLLRVIDRLVSAELAQQVLIFSGSRRENVGAFPFCELHGEVTDSAAAGVNQHALAWLQMRGVEQRLPRGQRRQRHGRRPDMMKRLRFEREFWFANDDIIGVRAVARWIGKAVNLVADLESSLGGGTRSDVFYRARDIPPENEREFMRPEVFHVAFTNFPIDRVHSGRVDS